MLPNPKNYAVFPAVLPTEQEVFLTVTPTERAFLFREGEAYTVTFITVDGDELNYYAASTPVPMSVVAEGGVLRLAVCCPEEGEYLLRLSLGEDSLGEVVIYALRSDLYGTLPVRADFHTHSFRSDGKRDPAALAGHFREMGYDAFALTDHNRAYPGGEIDEVYAEADIGICRVPGEEVHAPGYMIHIVHLFGEHSVAEQYWQDPEGFKDIIREQYLPRVPSTVPPEYRERYAAVAWVCEKIHEAGGLAVFAHPFWRPSYSRMHNVREELARIYLKSGLFDAYEVIGGIGHVGNNLSVALWQDLRSEGVRIPIVGSSDVHGLRASGSFPHCFTVCFAEENTPAALKEAVLAERTVAVEASGVEYERRYRAYGSFRLVAYAQFLLTHYFPEVERMAIGEGVAMRAYAMEGTPAETISALCRLSHNYTLRFFGREACKTPSTEMLDFEEKWRAVHRQSPDARGARVVGDKRGRQI